MPNEKNTARESSTKRRSDESHCPVCSEPVDPTGAAFPFCSARCRLVDLGKWLREDYSISEPAQERDLEEET